MNIKFKLSIAVMALYAVFSFCFVWFTSYVIWVESSVIIAVLFLLLWGQWTRIVTKYYKLHMQSAANRGA
jgi:hypothetical protein